MSEHTAIRMAHQRLVELLSPEELLGFILTGKFAKVLEAATNGWPFMIRRCSDGEFELVVEKPESQNHEA